MKPTAKWNNTMVRADGVVRVTELKFPTLRIIVHRMHGDDVSWYLTCYDVRKDNHALQAVTLEEAKIEATQRVMACLTAMMAELHDYMLYKP